MTTRVRYTDHGAEFDERFELIAGAHPGDLKGARDILRRACQPMPRSDMLKSLAVLRAMTAKRPETDDDQELQFNAYARALAEYPADVTRYVLETQPGLSKWWPAWAELAERLDRLSNRRKRMLDALERPAAIRAPRQAAAHPQAS